MAGGPSWTTDEDRAIRSLKPDEYNVWARQNGFPERGFSAITKRRSILNQMGVTPGLNITQPSRDNYPANDVQSPVQFSVPRANGTKPARYSQNTAQSELTRTFQDKRENRTSWRDHLEVVKTVRDHRERGSRSQDHGHVHIDTDRPVCVLVLSDTHLGSVGADVETFARITDDILTIPELFVILAGDLLNLAIQIKHGIGSFYEDVLTAGQQFDLLDDWLGEVQHKVLAATWDNHVQEREEKGVGTSNYARMMGERVIFHAGIGHLTVGVGQESYAWAVSHRFRGRSQLNPCHAQMQYVRYQAPDREIVAAGDSHVPGYAWFTHGGEPKLALNAGTLHTGSRYAKRYFSLTTSTAFPCVALWPDEHRFVAYPSVADWLAR